MAKEDEKEAIFHQQNGKKDAKQGQHLDTGKNTPVPNRRYKGNDQSNDKWCWPYHPRTLKK